MAHGVYSNLTSTRHQDHVSLAAQIPQKYATADYCTKKNGYLSLRSRRKSPVCAKTIIPSLTLAYNSINIDLGGSWGVQSRHICQRSRSCVPGTIKYPKVRYS